MNSNNLTSEQASSSSLTVAKFGGTSVADFSAMLRCANIIKNDQSTRLVVVSASSGVTNFLVRLSQKDVPVDEQKQIITNIHAIQLNITKHLTTEVEVALNQEISSLLDQLTAYALTQSLHYSAKTTDSILAFGEQLSSRIFAQVLQSIDVAGEYFNVQQVMKTNSLFGKAVVDIKQLAKQCQQLLSPKLVNKVIVTQGFIGQDASNNTTTLGRGGFRL